MEFKNLLSFIDKEDRRLKNNFENYPDQEKRILARTVKLNEEVGELCDEILSCLSFQRKDKLDKHDRNNLPKELADVIITVLLLAKAVDVDIKEALEKKIEKINQRYK